MMEVRRQKAEGRSRDRWHISRSLVLLLPSAFCFLTSILPSAFCFLLFNCARPTPTAAPVPPAPVPMSVPTPVAVVEPVKLPTLDEVRSLRTNNQLDLYEAGLKTLVGSTDAQTKGRALALLALLYVDQKRTAEALPLLREAANADPLVAPWLRLRAVDIEAADKRWADALLTTIRIIHDAPSSSAATIARLRLPALYAAAGDTSNTDDAFKSANAI